MRLVLSKGVLLVLASMSVTFVTTEIALPGEATREKVEALTGHAAERSREVPEHAEDSHLSDLLVRLPVVRVRSRLLGEVVVWVADSIEVAEEITEVVHRESELRRLTGRSPAEVRAVHEVRRALEGELMWKLCWLDLSHVLGVIDYIDYSL